MVAENFFILRVRSRFASPTANCLRTKSKKIVSSLFWQPVSFRTCALSFRRFKTARYAKWWKVIIHTVRSPLTMSRRPPCPSFKAGRRHHARPVLSSGPLCLLTVVNPLFGNVSCMEKNSITNIGNTEIEVQQFRSWVFYTSFFSGYCVEMKAQAMLGPGFCFSQLLAFLQEISSWLGVILAGYLFEQGQQLR